MPRPLPPLYGSIIITQVAGHSSLLPGVRCGGYCLGSAAGATAWGALRGLLLHVSCFISQ